MAAAPIAAGLMVAAPGTALLYKFNKIIDKNARGYETLFFVE
jgi:hypothetical protein